MANVMESIKRSIILIVGALLAGLTGLWVWGLLIGAGAAFLHCQFVGVTKGKLGINKLLACVPTMCLFGVMFLIGAQIGGGLTSVVGWVVTIIMMLVSAMVGGFVNSSKDITEKINQGDMAPQQTAPAKGKTESAQVEDEVTPASSTTEQASAPSTAEQALASAQAAVEQAIDSVQERAEKAKASANQAQTEQAQAQAPAEQAQAQAPAEQAQASATKIGVAAMLANARNFMSRRKEEPVEMSQEERTQFEARVSQATGLQEITNEAIDLAYKQIPADAREGLPKDPVQALAAWYSSKQPVAIVGPYSNVSPAWMRKFILASTEIEDEDLPDVAFVEKHYMDAVQKVYCTDCQAPISNIPILLLAYIIGHEKIEKESGVKDFVFTEDAEGIEAARKYIVNHTDDVLKLLDSETSYYPAELVQKYGRDAMLSANRHPKLGQDEEVWRLWLPKSCYTMPIADIAEKLGDSYDSSYEGESILSNVQKLLQ